MWQCGPPKCGRRFAVRCVFLFLRGSIGLGRVVELQTFFVHSRPLSPDWRWQNKNDETNGEKLQPMCGFLSQVFYGLKGG